MMRADVCASRAPELCRVSRSAEKVDDCDGESGTGRVVSAGGTDDAGADDDDIQGLSREHGSNMSHCSEGAKRACDREISAVDGLSEVLTGHVLA